MPGPHSQIIFHPVISWIQKVNLYEAKNMFCLVGSNNSTTRFRVLRIDRADARELTVQDDGMEYSPADLRRLMEKIENAPRSRHATGSAKIISAYGIVGFVKFTEGYYIILITQRQQVANIGHHIVYKVKNTKLVYIPQDVGRSNSPIEQRYMRIFQSIDLSSNFYFSYSYDLTKTLQSNMTPPSNFPMSAFNATPTDEEGPSSGKSTRREPQETQHFAVRSAPNERFVWNWNLIKPVLEILHPDWILFMIHGFVDQSNLNIFGKCFYISLIARRSRKYAGTRFLKRGANFEGDVANEVETEQMVFDASMPSFTHGSYSCFVQMRGSVPGHWSQDISKMVPKPQIAFHLSDPYGETSGKHFNQLLCRYGSPILILNLVKTRETKRQESVLTEELFRDVRYLNQFLPPKHHIRYKAFDMARMSKSKDENVMQRLTDIARSCVLKTGIFVSKPIPGPDENQKRVSPRYQTGVVRVNCVDCLDRTNTAQFVIGRWALGAQLCALGVLREPTLEFDTDCVRMLEALYEDHGDTLALQYGGSQLVHRIETYRKTAPWTSQGNDIMQTLSRYYSNTFSDAEKQNAINLFLGLFEPSDKSPHIWECLSDYYLHQSWAMGKIEKRMQPLTQWWNPEILPYLPRSYEELTQTSEDIYALRPDDESVDGYADYHRPFELTMLKDTFAFQVSHSVRDFMPNFTTNFSPFAVRVRPGRRREESGKCSSKNPSLTGQSSTGSTNSSGTSSSEESDDYFSDDDWENLGTESLALRQDDSSSVGPSFPSIFPSMAQVYGVQPRPPSRKDDAIYKRYQKMYEVSVGRAKCQCVAPIELADSRKRIPKDSCYSTAVPVVSDASIAKYLDYVVRGLEGAKPPKKSDADIYAAYAKQAAFKSTVLSR